MMLSEVLKKLQLVMEEHGDLHAIYSADDEGNRYQEVMWSGNIKYVDSIYDYDLEAYDEDEAEKGQTKVVCIN